MTHMDYVRSTIVHAASFNVQLFCLIVFFCVRLLQRVSNRKILWTGTLFFVVTLVVYLFADNFVGLLMARILTGFTVSLLESVLTKMASQVSTHNDTANRLALSCRVTMYIGGLRLSSVLGGLIFVTQGRVAVFLWMFLFVANYALPCAVRDIYSELVPKLTRTQP